MKEAPVKDMRVWISVILRWGVLISALLILLGGILFLFQHPQEVLSFKKFSGQPERLRRVDLIFSEALQWRSRSVIQLGILVLIATPIMRVFFSLLEFLFHKDWTFVIITLIVFCTLLYSLTGG